MPKELRKIVFSEAEVQSAAVSHCLHARVPLPDANIIGIEIANASDETVKLRFSTSNPADPDTVALNRGQVAAALIRYCQDHQIPLPRAAQKALQKDAEGLALFVNLDYGTPRDRSRGAA